MVAFEGAERKTRTLDNIERDDVAVGMTIVFFSQVEGGERKTITLEIYKYMCKYGESVRFNQFILFQDIAYFCGWREDDVGGNVMDE